MKPLALLTFACAWLAGCETPPSAPRSQTPLIPPPSFATLANERVPLAGSFAINTCPPEEEVQIVSGFLHTVVTGEIGATTEDVTIQVNAEDVEGVGLVTGARYTEPANSKEVITITDVPPTLRQEFDIRYRLIREGSLDDLWFRLTFTLTVPGTEDVRRLEIECRS